MLISRIVKSRNDNKSNQQRAFSALRNYGVYGEDSPTKDVLSESQLKAYNSQQLCDAIKQLFNYKHRILYYGPESIDNLKSIIARDHKMPAKFAKTPVNKQLVPKAVNKNTIYFVDYNANQTYMQEYIRGDKFDVKILPQLNLFNEYFGGSMNAIVFQEMREKRSLAYSAQSYYVTPNRKDGYFTNVAIIATQNDKLLDAMNAFSELFEEMPVAEANFKMAQDAAISSIRTDRTTKFSIISSYLTYEKMGFDMKKTRGQILFETYPTLSMQDLVNFNHKYLKGQKKFYMVLGRESDMDFNALSKFGKVKKLTLEDIFGY